jgi:hypothetical protein
MYNDLLKKLTSAALLITIFIASCQVELPKLPLVYHETVSEKSANGGEYKSERTLIVPGIKSQECRTTTSSKDLTTNSKSVDPSIGLDLSVPLELGKLTKPNPHPKNRRQRRMR